MEQEQKDVIQDIYNTLESVSKDERTEYNHTVRNGKMNGLNP